MPFANLSTLNDQHCSLPGIVHLLFFPLRFVKCPTAGIPYKLLAGLRV